MLKDEIKKEIKCVHFLYKKIVDIKVDNYY
jgi:hypothetical protein